jgi:hypothetical protein
MKTQATEHQEQVALFQWANSVKNQYPMLEWLFAIPNGGKRDIVTAAKMKREGLKMGIFDLCLPYPVEGFHGLYIEMKRKGGKPSKKQREFQDYLLSQGYVAVVCEGWIEAKNVIERYLSR